MERIHLSLCHMGGSEIEYVKKAFQTNWIVPLGPEVDEFENRLSSFLDTNRPVVALSSGTAAIHLGLLVAGVSPGDEVVCQSLTFAASANPINYLGANPVFVDSETTTWNIDPVVLLHTLEDRKEKTGRYPRAVIPVHLYGMPADMEPIMKICAERGVAVVEDAAEALGSMYAGKHCGTFGKFAALSFNGNKIITTSGGGAIICPDEESAQRVLFYATQAREKCPYYYHRFIGYNYRLSNVSAAIGCGQMEVLPDFVTRRQQIHRLYVEILSDIPGVYVHSNSSDKYDSNYWLTTIQLDPEKIKITPDQLRMALAEQNIESRLIWRPMHLQPVFADAPYYGDNVAETIFNRGLCLPSGSNLTDSHIERVTDAIRAFIKY